MSFSSISSLFLNDPALFQEPTITATSANSSLPSSTSTPTPIAARPALIPIPGSPVKRNTADPASKRGTADAPAPKRATAEPSLGGAPVVPSPIPALGTSTPTSSDREESKEERKDRKEKEKKEKEKRDSKKKEKDEKKVGAEGKEEKKGETKEKHHREKHQEKKDKGEKREFVSSLPFSLLHLSSIRLNVLSPFTLVLILFLTHVSTSSTPSP